MNSHLLHTQERRPAAHLDADSNNSYNTLTSTSFAEALKDNTPQKIKPLLNRLSQFSDAKKCEFIIAVRDHFNSSNHELILKKILYPNFRLFLATLKKFSNSIEDPEYKARFKGFFKTYDSLFLTKLKEAYLTTDNPGWLSSNITLFNSFRSSEGVINDMQTRKRENKGGSSEQCLNKLGLRN